MFTKEINLVLIKILATSKTLYSIPSSQPILYISPNLPLFNIISNALDVSSECKNALIELPFPWIVIFLFSLTVKIKIRNNKKFKITICAITWTR